MRNTTAAHIGLALLRIVPSIFMLTHGYPKLVNLVEGHTDFLDPFGIGATPTLFLTVIGEFICPVLLIIGFKTRWVSLPPAITMFVAAFVIHNSDPFGQKELALLYLTCFVAVFLVGPGRYSVDEG